MIEKKKDKAFKDFSRCLMPSPDANATKVTNVLYLMPKTGQIDSVSSSFCTKFFMITICESAFVTIKSYMYL